MKEFISTLPGIQVIHYYRGDLNNDVLNSIIRSVEKKLRRYREKTSRRKQINRAIIELLQNVMYYKEGVKIYKDFPPEFILIKWDNNYLIGTRNVITKSKQKKLDEYLKTLNNMNEQELQKKYREVLKNGIFNEQGGAGLGLLDVILKSANQHLKYEFKDINNNFVFFDIYVLI